MAYTQKNKDEKGKKSKECNKKETWIDDNIIIIMITNDSNRKGKAWKVATKKTL